MTNRFNRKNTKICVAVKFDDVGKRVIKVAEQFCQRTGASMHLVSVCENILANNFVMMAPLPGELLQITQQSLEEVSESKMAELAKTIHRSIQVTTSVSAGTLGDPAELIEAEALANNCSLIVVGTTPGNHRFVPRGFSCALSLMSTSKLPVMVVNENQTKNLDAPTLQMVIADDLKAHSLSSVTGGFHLAFAFTKTDIHHVYTNGVTLKTLETAIDSAMATAHTQPSAAVSAKNIHDLMLKQLKENLESRTTGMSTSLELSSCHYQADIVTDSSVTDCLEKYCVQKNANIAIFGRHNTVHHKPFGIGQMPYFAMLNLKCPVVVFPSNADD